MEIDTIYKLLEGNSEQREKLLSHLTEIQTAQLIKFCNKYPDIQMKAVILNDPISSEQIFLEIKLQHTSNQEYHLSYPKKNKLVVKDSNLQDYQLNDSFFFVDTFCYPGNIEEGWWVLGVDTNGTVLFIKKVYLHLNKLIMNSFKVQFTAPGESGIHKITIHLMSDSYCGCDQEFIIEYIVSDNR